MASSALVARGNSLALSRDALLVFGGAALGPVGALIGIAAAIGLEGAQLRLEGYRIQHAHEQELRDYELRRQHLEILENDRINRYSIGAKAAEVAAIRAETERRGVEGALFIAQARLNSNMELSKMRHRVEMERLRINRLGPLIALDTLAIKADASTHHVKVSQFQGVLERAFETASATQNSELHFRMFQYTLMTLERLGNEVHNRRVITSEIVDQVLRVPDLVSVQRTAITRG